MHGFDYCTVITIAVIINYRSLLFHDSAKREARLNVASPQSERLHLIYVMVK